MNAADSTSDSKADWVQATTLEALKVQRRLLCKLQGMDVLLLLQGDGVVALENRCSHVGKPLDRGRVMGGQITCPAHGACFDLRNGKPLAGPAVTPIHLFPARIRDDGSVEVDMSNKPNTSAGSWFGSVTQKSAAPE